MHIVDTTLRDGEQKAGIALNTNDKVRIAKLLDYIGVSQIEAGTPSMGGAERSSIRKIVDLGLSSRISSWNRMNVKDLEGSMECGIEIVHMSVPASDLHIKMKFNQNRTWVIEQMKRCVSMVNNKGVEIHVGLEDASRADMDFLTELCKVANEEGAARVRYADTVGVLTPQKVYKDIQLLKVSVPTIEIGIHAHNDFGMAVANSLVSIGAGVQYVDCTIGGVGERTGNCNCKHLLLAMSLQRIMDEKQKVTLDRLIEVEEEIMSIYYNKRSSSFNTHSLA